MLLTPDNDLQKSPAKTTALQIEHPNTRPTILTDNHPELFTGNINEEMELTTIKKQ